MDLNNIHGSPDLGELEKLANELFKATPDKNFGGGKFEDIGKARPHAVENNFAGAERAPENTFARAETVNEPKAPVINTTPINSATGSGLSSTSFGTGNNFDMAHPQTSLLDPHFTNGEIPQSVSGVTSALPSANLKNGNPTNAVSVKENTVFDKMPFENENSFHKELQTALSHVHSFAPASQLPFDFPTGKIEDSFYFLSGHNPFQGFNGLPTDAAHSNNRATHGITSFVKPPFNMNQVKADFPILKEKVNGKPVIWFDNAATTQKPQAVIDRISYFYAHENSNIHRAAHDLAARATDAYEAARQKVQQFINAASINEIIFVRGTTEGINLVANTWGDQHIREGDEIILSHLEHHANIVPWKMLATRKGARLRIIPVDDDGQIILEEYGKLLNSRTKLVAFTHVSNALGTITPAKQMIDMAHAQGAKVLLDGAQSVSHMRINVQHLNPDFFVFSGHKVFGPTGIGAVYGKEQLLNETQPWQGGGNMIKDVTFENIQYDKAPGKFEAGTGNIADAVGLGAALDYVSKIGIDLIDKYEHALLAYATNLIRQVPGIRLIGTAKDKASVLSFTLHGYTNDEVGKHLNKEGIAVRTGHHCAQPILRRFGLETSVRPSLAFYNTCGEVDVLISTLHRLAENKKQKGHQGHQRYPL